MKKEMKTYIIGGLALLLGIMGVNSFSEQQKDKGGR